MDNLKLLSKIALSFQNIDNFDKDMNEILEKVGRFIDVSRIYVFFNENKDTISNTFEWCSELVIPQIDNLQKITYKDAANFQDIISKKGYISSNDVTNMPGDIIDILKTKHVKSLVAYSLLINNKIVGFIGFNECRYKRTWKQEELQILGTLSGIIANAYERKKIQQDIRDSETNFRNFFETIDDMFFVGDSHGNILTTNSSAREKLGYSSFDFEKMNLIELHPQESRQEASVLLQEMLKKERKFCPIPFISKSGEIYSVESRVWTGKWNKEDCIYAVSKDLTKENEDFQVFSKIFENNALPMAIKDIEKNEFINVNPALFKMLGYKEKLVIENKTDSIDLFIDSSKLKSYTNKKINGEEVKDKEIDIINIYKKELKCLLSIEDITIQGKKSFLIILIDITERDELAKSVEDKLQKLTNVIDGTSLGTWEWNILTKELQVNKHFANMLGYSKNEVGIFTSDTFNEFINPEEVELSNEILKRHLNGELDYYDIEMRMKHKDGRWIWIHNIGRVTQRDKTGMPIKMFGTYSNINVNDKMKMYN